MSLHSAQNRGRGHDDRGGQRDDRQPGRVIGGRASGARLTGQRQHGPSQGPAYESRIPGVAACDAGACVAS